MRIEFNNEGFRTILQSPECQALVLSHATEIADRANGSLTGASEGFRTHSVKAPSRYIAFAGTTDEESVRAESENKVLSRAVG